MKLRAGLGLAEWMAVAGGLLLALSLIALPWFGLSVHGIAQSDSDGNAFELLGGLDVVLLLAALVPLVVPALRAGATSGLDGDWAPRLVTGAGVLAAVLTIYVVLDPPDPDAVLAVAVDSTADIGLEARAGAFIGLVAAVAIAAGGALELVSRPAPQSASTAPPATETPAEPRPEPKPLPPSEPRSVTEATPKRKVKPKTLAPPRKPRPAAKTKPRRSPEPKPAAASGRLRLATASADDLVAIGFSPTQAARIVAYRDKEAIVTKVADLKRVPGISKPVLAKLVEHLDD